MEIQSASAVTSSSVSTGAARIASYVRWNWFLELKLPPLWAYNLTYRPFPLRAL
jgi:hypothetical protein